MKRFNCPRCQKFLFFRLLPQATSAQGEFAFFCIYCGALLTYNKSQPLLFELLWGTGLRRFLTIVLGGMFFSFVRSKMGFSFNLKLTVILALVLLASHLFAKKPLYTIVECDNSTPLDTDWDCDNSTPLDTDWD